MSSYCVKTGFTSPVFLLHSGSKANHWLCLFEVDNTCPMIPLYLRYSLRLNPVGYQDDYPDYDPKNCADTYNPHQSGHLAEGIDGVKIHQQTHYQQEDYDLEDFFDLS